MRSCHIPYGQFLRHTVLSCLFATVLSCLLYRAVVVSVSFTPRVVVALVPFPAAPEIQVRVPRAAPPKARECALFLHGFVFSAIGRVCGLDLWCLALNQNPQARALAQHGSRSGR